MVDTVEEPGMEQSVTEEEHESEPEHRKLKCHHNGPEPRRSTRERRPPDRYGDFVMSKMVQPVDTKIVAAATLMQSGILNSMDTETAHIILAAICNK